MPSHDKKWHASMQPGGSALKRIFFKKILLLLEPGKSVIFTILSAFPHLKRSF
jgi:hypothetical protein